MKFRQTEQTVKSVCQSMVLRGATRFCGTTRLWDGLIRTFSKGDVTDLDREDGRAQARCAALVTDAEVLDRFVVVCWQRSQ